MPSFATRFVEKVMVLQHSGGVIGLRNIKPRLNWKDVETHFGGEICTGIVVYHPHDSQSFLSDAQKLTVIRLVNKLQIDGNLKVNKM